ncbi:MAG: archaeosine biosynthesis radical SAM protein RaSEA [bacterium]|nr:archaeosine biosynthesis radical SAM protein RaSEA [bacterium]
MRAEIEKLFGYLQKKGLEKELEKNSYYDFISEMQGQIHDLIPDEHFDTTKIAAPPDIRQELFEGVNYKRAVIFLMSNGCEWALKSAHGCVMCGHISKQTRREENVIPTEDFIRQFDDGYRKLDLKETPLLNIYNNGSFLNDREIPARARTEIFKKIAGNPDIKMVVFESRPEFITEDKIVEMSELLQDKHVEVAIGLEMKNDFYRKLCLNKGFPLKTFEAGAGHIVDHLHLKTYVFLKPPFLTEKESIDEAVATADYAFQFGAGTVSIEACTIQDFTLVKYLHKAGLYQPPRLWSIIEVVKRVKNPGKLIIGMFQFFPFPTEVPFNCKKCSHDALEAIKRYNRTLDVTVFDHLDCQCKAQWQKELEKEYPPLKERLEYSLEKLEISK